MATITKARQGALGFASLGYGVIPLHGVTKRGDRLCCTCGRHDCEAPGKHPFARLAPHGLKDAVTDLDKIRAWPHSWLSYGIVTDQLIVIDIDPRHAGDKTWKELSRQTTRHVPHTWQVRTGGGGEHIIFTNASGLKGCVLGAGVEIKAIGGYIVGVGCNHISGGSYQWAPGCSPKDVEPSPPPLWLFDEINKRQAPTDGERKPPEFWTDLAGDGIHDGKRNVSWLPIIGHFVGCGVDSFLAWTAIRCMNITICLPPEDEEKLEGMFNRIMAAECRKRGL